MTNNYSNSEYIKGIITRTLTSMGIILVMLTYLPYNQSSPYENFKEKNKIDSIYNFKKDSLKKNYEIQLKNLETKFKEEQTK